MTLLGHHALVTGGGTGIGAAIAAALAHEGASVTVVGRRAEPLRQTIKRIRKSGRSAQARDAASEAADNSHSAAAFRLFHHVADVTDANQVNRAFEAARRVLGPISILINNAGSAQSAPFRKVTVQSWKSIIAVNLDALFYCSHAALPDLLRAPAARIVTIASTAALTGYAYAVPYCAAKHGAVGFTRELAAELSGTGVTVNAVCPGFTDTQIVSDAVKRIGKASGRDEIELRSELANLNAHGRLITPAEVASAVLWLCSAESQSINGQAIAVAGGEA